MLDSLQAAAAAEGARLGVVPDDERVDVTALVADGDRREFADARWRRQLARWMHPRQAGDGLPVPELTGPATRFVVRHLNVGSSTAREDAKPAERSPASPSSARTATAAGPDERRPGAGAAPPHRVRRRPAGLVLNQAIQVEELRPRLAARVPGAGHPRVLLRLGYPAGDVEAAPRRPLDAVIESVRG